MRALTSSFCRSPETLVVSADMRAVLSRKLPEIPAPLLEIQLAEFLRFIELAAHTRARRLPISVELDAIWHVFILETREYANLCAQAGGFVHHTTISDTVLDDQQSDLDDDLEFVVAYVGRYGGFTEAAIPFWPALQRVAMTINCPLTKVINIAQELASSVPRRPMP
jgi:hypothetical protein